MIDGTSLSFAPLLPWPLLGRARARHPGGLRPRPVAARARHPVAQRAAGARPAGARQPGGDPRAARAARRHRAGAGRPLALADRRRRGRSSSIRRSRELRAELEQLEGLEVVETSTAGDGKGGTRLFETLGNSAARDRPRAARGRAGAVGRPGPRRAGEPRAARHRRADPPAADRRAATSATAASWSSRCRTTAWSATSGRSRCGSTSCRRAAPAEPVTVTLRQDGELKQRLTVPRRRDAQRCRSS